MTHVDDKCISELIGMKLVSISAGEFLRDRRRIPTRWLVTLEAAAPGTWVEFNREACEVPGRVGRILLWWSTEF